jgi:hypothetical protein
MEGGIPMTEDELRKIQIIHITKVAHYDGSYTVKAYSKDKRVLVVVCRSNIKNEYVFNDLDRAWEIWFSNGILVLGIDDNLINIIR